MFVRLFSLVCLSLGVSTLGTLPALAAGVIEPPTDDERMVRAVDALNAEQYDVAFRDLLQLVATHDDNADFWNLMGFAARQTGRMDMSWEAYQRALALDPDHVQTRNYLGYLYLSLGDAMGAEEQLEKIAMICESENCDEYIDLEIAIEEFGEQ